MGRKGIGQYFTNMRAPMPFPYKLFLLARNSWLRIARAQNCCGHPGQPGC